MGEKPSSLVNFIILFYFYFYLFLFIFIYFYLFLFIFIYFYLFLFIFIYFYLFLFFIYFYFIFLFLVYFIFYLTLFLFIRIEILEDNTEVFLNLSQYDVRKKFTQENRGYSIHIGFYIWQVKESRKKMQKLNQKLIFKPVFLSSRDYSQSMVLNKGIKKYKKYKKKK